MPEDLHDFVFFNKNFDRALGTLVPFLSEAQVKYFTEKSPIHYPKQDRVIDIGAK